MPLKWMFAGSAACWDTLAGKLSNCSGYDLLKVMVSLLHCVHAVSFLRVPIFKIALNSKVHKSTCYRESKCASV